MMPKGLPPYLRGRVQIFHAASPDAATSCTGEWRKPAGCSWVYVFCLGSGSGGGGGASSGAAAGGGCGGGSGLLATGLFFAPSIPDRLYVGVASGGPGGPADTIGSQGRISFVSTFGSTLAASDVLRSSNGAPGGGNPGVGAAGGNNAGTTGSAATEANCNYASAGLHLFQSGRAGGPGGASNQAGVNQTALVTLYTGGCGGGGHDGTTDHTGGLVSAVSTLWPGTAGGVVAGGAGNPGFESIPMTALLGTGVVASPLFFFTAGGTGGGANKAGVGGAGGKGGLGSGGGGGGGGTTGGAGGPGGDGLVVIIAY